MADAALTRDCPSCSLPGQHVGMACGWCGANVPVPQSALLPDGSVKVAEIFGFRGFKVSNADREYPYHYDPSKPALLRSPLFTEYEWPAGGWATAECHTHGDYDPTDPHYHGSLAADPELWSPVKDCGGAGHGCGFYCGRTWGHLIDLGYGRYHEDDPHVIAQVQLAGKIIPATNGFRAQRMRPVVIYVPHELWKIGAALKDTYGAHGVKIEMAATLVPAKSETPKWCSKCMARMKPRDLTCPLCGHRHI